MWYLTGFSTNRDLESGIAVVLQDLAAVGADDDGQRLFWDFFIARLTRYLRGYWMVRTVLCLDPDRSVLVLDVSVGPASDTGTKEATFEGENSTASNEGVVFHIR